MLFENPATLSVLLILLEGGVVGLWFRRRSLRSSRLALAGLVAIPALVSVNLLYVTPRERIVALCEDLRRQVQDGNTAGIGEHLSDAFFAAGYSRAAFLARVGDRLKRVRVDEAQLRGIEVRWTHPDEAEATINAWCRVRSGEGLAWRFPSRWKLTWRRRGDTWLVTGLQAVPIPLSPVRSLDDVLR